MTPPRPGILERLSAALADRYRVERELGQGGMSTVFLAEDLRHNRPVAIKVLREDLAASMGSARFLREIRIAAGLQHPNILPLLDSGDADGLLFYVMPFVKGQSLRERLEHEGELPVSEAVRLLTEVVDALALAHEQGVVHRDVKPDNVMISGRHALVTDFGVAKALAESRPAEGPSRPGTPSGVTTLGVAVGTPAYMSPEQAAADPHVDQRADIYAIGAMAYELLCGRPPFAGTTPQRVLAAQVTEQPEPLSKRRDSVPPALEAVVMRCLEKRPADRWQSAGELLQQLEPLAATSGGATPTQLTPVGVARAGGPRRIVWAVAGLAVLALAAGGVALWRRGAGTAAPVAWDRVQITSTGDAEAALASPDGKQVVYSSRTCTQEGACDWQLVLYDLPTGTRQVLEDSLDTVEPQAWSRDGNWLLVAAASRARGLPVGGYVVSHLGGAMTSLGGRGAFAPRGDTALAASKAWSGRDTVWVRRFVPPWTQPLDSFPIAPPASPETVGIETMSVSPSGRWLAVEWGLLNSQMVIHVYDRTGRSVDSLGAPLDRPGGQDRSLGWSAAGRHLLVGVKTASGGSGLLRVAVDPSTGRLGARDTLLLATTGSAPPTFGLSADGAVLAYTVTQPGQQILWTLSASHPGTVPMPQRRARTASAGLESLISPDGSTVVYTEQAESQGGRALRFLAEPFGGGASHAVTPPLPVVSVTITSDSRSLIVATRASSGGTRLTAYDLASGEAHPLTELPDSLRSMTRAGPEGVAVVPVGTDSILVLDGHGRITERLAVPDSLGAGPHLSPSPDGREFALLTTPKDIVAALARDGSVSGPISRLSAQGVVSRIGVARFFHLAGVYWVGGGAVWWIGTQVLDQPWSVYRIPVAGGEQTRLGPLPFPDGCTCSLSADGTRGTAVVQKPLTDVWVIRNFDDGRGR